MTDLDLRRRFYAEELEAVCKRRSPALVDALSVVRREHFLRPGPWTVLSGDWADGLTPGAGARTRATPDADPARVFTTSRSRSIRRGSCSTASPGP
jgi:hypothetical protein